MVEKWTVLSPALLNPTGKGGKQESDTNLTLIHDPSCCPFMLDKLQTVTEAEDQTEHTQPHLTL